jgi:hypothetical protein
VREEVVDMRWFDLYVGLLAAAMAFAAAVTWTSEMPLWVPSLALALGVGFLGAMVVRARTTKKILIVGAPARERFYGLESTLDEAGYAVTSCVGPAARECPVFRGEPCPVTSHPVAALLVTPEGYAGPFPPCEHALRIPAMRFALNATDDDRSHTFGLDADREIVWGIAAASRN